MNQEFCIGDVVDILDYVNDQKVLARGTIKNRWFSRALGEYIYVVRTTQNAVGEFRGCYLRSIPDGLSANVVIIDEIV